MRVTIENPLERAACFANIKAYVEAQKLVATKYLDLGVKVVRVLCYTPEVLSHLARQCTFVLRDSAERYDDTIVVWKETDLTAFAKTIGPQFDPRRNMRLRLEMLYAKGKYPSFEVTDGTSVIPFMYVSHWNDVFEAHDAETKTLYYAVSNFDPEEFIKLGHMFIQQLNPLLKPTTANIAHGAILGYNNNGVLFCARGQRGKSTLTVHSMMQGLDYVSDDYQILDQESDGLYSYPIYSIITLSPTMYSELYDELKGKFVSNNARKDKYVINIADYHGQFRTRYPIRLCIFPEIVSKPDTEIYPCSEQEKGRAIVQLIQSTVSQMRDMNDPMVIRKMLGMVKNLPFYKVDLCRNIAANTENLRVFLETYDFNNPVVIEPPRVMVDITFDLANILDSETCTIYSLNKFATNIYENLLMGRAAADIRAELAPLAAKNPQLLEAFDLLVKTLDEKGFLSAKGVGETATTVNLAFAEECQWRLSLNMFASTGTKDLINPSKGDK